MGYAYDGIMMPSVPTVSLALYIYGRESLGGDMMRARAEGGRTGGCFEVRARRAQAPLRLLPLSLGPASTRARPPRLSFAVSSFLLCFFFISFIFSFFLFFFPSLTHSSALYISLIHPTLLRLLPSRLWNPRPSSLRNLREPARDAHTETYVWHAPSRDYRVGAHDARAGLFTLTRCRSGRLRCSFFGWPISCVGRQRPPRVAGSRSPARYRVLSGSSIFFLP